MTDEFRTGEPGSEEITLRGAELTVVICSLNGETGINRCLDALGKQTFHGRLEVVVVDDGSTDSTSSVARAHGAIVIRHQVNRGLAAARNSGVRAATAPIVAFLDDDCEPEPEWAERLIAGYRDGIIGVGGPVLPSGPDNFIIGYLQRHNPLVPLELNLTKSEKLGYRFSLYLKRQWVAEQADGKRDVYSFVGANMSFRRQAVIDAGWFDERFSFAGEETDLCRRMTRMFPAPRLFFTPEARVIHHFKPSLRDTLRRSRAYGLAAARFYRKWPTMCPTFYPWPVLVLALVVSSMAFPLLAVAAVAAPQVLYPAPVRTALSQRRLDCVLDAYIHLARETYGDIGFLHGLWAFRHFVPQPAIESAKSLSAPAAVLQEPPVTRRPRFPANCSTLLVLLASLALLVPIHGWWAAQLLLILLLLTIPGVILLRAMRIPGSAIAAFPVYVPCASLVMLLGSGLAVDLVGLAAGVAAPLRSWSMLAALELVCLILLAFSANAPPSVAIPWRNLSRPGWNVLPLLLPLVSAAGAVRLNNDRGGGVALIALCACVLVTVAVLLCPAKFDASLMAVVLYAVGLAMLWSFSLRGASVYGFDISDEYYIFQHTVTSGVWHPAHPNNAYAAMLSTTVLPTELHFVAGVPDLLVFKVIYPAISALFPVAVFFIGRRILAPRWAFTAGALIFIQTAFGQELPALARQEIALVLFTALASAILEAKLPRRLQFPLVISFALAMVVSHYSTTYVTIVLLGMTIVFQWAASRFHLVPRISGAMAVAFIAATAGSVIWYGPVTHSSSNVAQLAQITRSQGLNLLPNRTQAGGWLAAYLEGDIPTSIPVSQYARLVHGEYADKKPFIHPLPDAGNPAYELGDSVTPPVRENLGYNAFSLGDILAQQLTYPLGALGALILIFRRKVPAIARQIGLLTMGALVFLVAIRFSGTLATSYNAPRALLQGAVFLYIPLFWCLQAWVGQRERRQMCAAIVGAALIALIFVVSYGLVGAVLGGSTATNLANSGGDFEQFYTTTPELASATWLGSQLRHGQLVYADQHAQLPLVSMTGISTGLVLDVTPETLNSHAWVYASQTNMVDGRATALFEGHSVSYVFPSKFLNANYNLVYTNGSSEVYNR
jgi:uncharacterized membrane protein/glycosyltransferase involved in cell wall biosynthesis